MISEEARAPAPVKRRRISIALLPLLIFAVIGVFLAIGLKLDPRKIPSPLLGKKVPEFSLPPVKGRELGLADSDLKTEVSLVNVFASWCLACRQEHPLLVEIDRQGLAPVHGLNYKDHPEDAARWLDDLGDPYTRTGADIEGDVAIDWGVYGLPETFVVDRNGYIVYKQIGAITPQLLEEVILPLVMRLQSDEAPVAE